MTERAPRAGGGEDFADPRRHFVLAAALMAMFMAAVEATIVATAMPTIVATLGSFHLFSWVFATYLLTQAVTVPIYGRLADLYGRKRVFYAGAGLFLIGSTLCGFAWDMMALIAFRGLQGLGAGAILPIAMTIVGDIYAPADRARVQGYVASVWGVSAVIGPLLGAILVQQFSWALIFWVNLPIGVAAMVMLAVFLKERPQAREHELDIRGAVLLVVGAGALMLALVQAVQLGAVLVAVLLAVAAAALTALYRHERRAAEPMIPFWLWQRALLVTGNLGCLAIGTVMMGVTVFLPAFVQGVMGRSPAAAGFALTFMSLGWASSGSVAGRLMLRFTYRAVAVLGAVCLMVGNAVLFSLGIASGPVMAGAGAFLVGCGMGFSNTTYIVAVQGSVAHAQRGAATSSIMFMRSLGQALGAALFGAVVNLSLNLALPGQGDVLDRLMEPALRAAIAADELARLGAATSWALGNAYALAAAIGLLALWLALRLPAGLNAANAAAPREAPARGR